MLFTVRVPDEKCIAYNGEVYEYDGHVKGKPTDSPSERVGKPDDKLSFSPQNFPNNEFNIEMEGYEWEECWMAICYAHEWFFQNVVNGWTWTIPQDGVIRAGGNSTTGQTFTLNSISLGLITANRQSCAFVKANDRVAFSGIGSCNVWFLPQEY